MRRATRLSVPCLAAGVLLTACSSDPASPPECEISSVAVSVAASIEVGESVTATATVNQQYCDNTDVTWSSSNDGVASVSSTGLVTGVAAGGPVTISATVDGVTGNATVNVTVAAVASITLESPFTSLATGSTMTIAATLRDARGVALTGRTITWSTANAAVATVADGVVTAVALGGPVNITATSGAASAMAPVSVVSRYAYVFANAASATSPYDGNALSSYSTLERVSTITRIGTGTYTVRMRGMATSSPTAVLANAFGGPGTCQVQDWINDTGDIVATVRCVDFAGGAADHQFFVTLFGADAFPGRFAFAWANQETVAGPYTPNGNYAFNASGQPISINRSGTGSYGVTFTGNGRPLANDPAETFHVVAYGPTPARCQVTGWGYVGAGVGVRCTDPAGTVIDSKFVILMLEAGRPGQRHAVAWSNCFNVSCTPDGTYSSSTGGATNVTRTSNGTYNVVFTGLARTTGTDNVLVTSYGSNGSVCKVTSIDNAGSDLAVQVLCLTAAGVASDQMFDIAVIP